MKIAIYCRVSTKEQDTASQTRVLREYARNRGLDVFDEYLDAGFSGAKVQRPELSRLMDDARKRRFSGVLVFRFDRFARSSSHLVSVLEEFNNLGISFISYSENIDLSSALGKAMFTVIAAMAQLERDIICDRVAAGLREARAKGKRLGRPRKIDRSILSSLRSNGCTISAMARQIGVSRTAVRKALAA